MSEQVKHITVCICTFKRPEFLRRLLDALEEQHTDGRFSYSVVVADNDRFESGRDTVQSFQQTSRLEALYCVEPEQNIALARNRAVEHARGDLAALIDDDEFPGRKWLLELFKAYFRFGADGILGPVLPHYDSAAPQWVIKGKFYERESHKTGTVLPWTSTRTGNVLLRRAIFDDKNNLFRREFSMGGEDRDFFNRMIDRGYRFVWCNEAPVYETVPPERYSRRFMLRRALMRGKIPYNHTVRAHLKSLLALSLYTVMLPLLIPAPHHLFMKYLVKYFDHLGRILAWMGVDVIKEKYVLK